MDSLQLSDVFATGARLLKPEAEKICNIIFDFLVCLGPCGFFCENIELVGYETHRPIFQCLKKVASMKNQSIFEGFCAPEPRCSNLRRRVRMNTTLVSYKSGLAEVPKFLANLTDLSPLSCNGFATFASQDFLSRIWSGLCNLCKVHDALSDQESGDVARAK